MKPEQYRLVKQQLTWRVLVTWGLLKTEFLAGHFKTLQDAQIAARQHAARFGNLTPVILR